MFGKDDCYDVLLNKLTKFPYCHSTIVRRYSFLLSPSYCEGYKSTMRWSTTTIIHPVLLARFARTMTRYVSIFVRGVGGQYRERDGRQAYHHSKQSSENLLMAYLAVPLNTLDVSPCVGLDQKNSALCQESLFLLQNASLRAFFFLFLLLEISFQRLTYGKNEISKQNLLLLEADISNKIYF